MEEFIRLDEKYLLQAAQLFSSSFADEPWNDDWSDQKMLTEYIKEVSGGYNALNYGLLIDEKLAAISLGQIRHWWEGANYNINEFCVSKDFHGKGIGSRFIKMIEDDLKKNGIAGIFLQTDIDKPSFKFYTKNGFSNLEKHVSLFKGIK
ncbi:MAG: GNAT family N-acetyltransferase [Treponema sp.]|nr:GNAT family N-acetyltransferase [Treponema sp.]